MSEKSSQNEWPEDSERKRSEQTLKKRLLSLTQPLGENVSIAFEDLFNPADIQQLQDEFALATGVASIITRPDGTPITRPSNFCRLCKDIIRRTDKGLANCFKSDAVLGRYNPDGPTIQPCLSSGLWDAGAGISVGERHVANWLIGQVRNASQTEDQMRSNARQIGVDEETFIAAFSEVPSMSYDRFRKVANVLFTLANQLSQTAHQNLQQARFITAKEKAEEALKARESFLNRVIDQSPFATWISDANGTLQRTNPALRKTLNLTDEQLVGQYNVLQDPLVEKQGLMPLVRSVYEQGRTARFTCQWDGNDISTLDLKGSNAVHIDMTVFPVLNAAGDITHVVFIWIDITDRKNTEEALKKSEAQLRQAQKMESVGRLAGGVAHDFNNMLSIILGNAEIMMEEMAPDNPLMHYLSEINRAALRSSELTRQLLAFARKQTIAPKVIDLNHTVEGMLKMLRRLIGEDIDLAWHPKTNLWPVKVDPSQVDQILANLCVNARDAIKGVGRMTIETDNVHLDAEYCREHTGFIPGDFVLIAVGDDGCGMDRTILDNLFEPFFTTKDTGKGTGLGLATVYGIVKQNNGFITVYSEVDTGTIFRIYLPRHAREGLRPTAPSPLKGDLSGSETVLLVEDETAILQLTRMMLQRLGYVVLTASGPGDAVRTATAYPDRIHLLMTDVVMPEMSGKDLARTLRSILPDLKCLFMSGYTANVIAHHGILDDNINFINKPFLKTDLAAKLREVLDGDDEWKPK